MNKVLMFVLGAATGSVITWAIIREKYKRIADEEIESVVQRFKDREKNDGELIHSSGLSLVEHYSKDEGVTTSASYTKMVNDLGYTNEEMDELLQEPGVTMEQTEDGEYEVFIEPTDDHTAPYTISPDEYGEKEDYDTKSWMYYSDNVLTDEKGEIIIEAENMIGDALTRFGEFEDDSVYVRNENEECDYEILKQFEPFSDDNRGAFDE